MKIDLHRTIAGQSIREIRDFLRSLVGSEFAADFVTKYLGINVTDQLLGEGLIEPTLRLPTSDGGEIQFYRVSTAGKRLALTRLNRRIRRSTAERMVATFLDRVAAVNADPDLLLRVASVDAFGSYITQSPDLGDIDLALGLERKSFPGRDWVDLNFERAEASGRSLTFLQSLCFGDDEVMRRLRNHSAYLSLHTVEELEKLGCERRRIFPPEPSSAATARPRSPQRHHLHNRKPRRRSIPARARSVIVLQQRRSTASRQPTPPRRRILLPPEQG